MCVIRPLGASAKPLPYKPTILWLLNRYERVTDQRRASSCFAILVKKLWDKNNRTDVQHITEDACEG